MKYAGSGCLWFRHFDLISAQNLENELMELHQILIMHWHYQIYTGIVKRQFSQIYNMVMDLGYCQNFVSAQYLKNESMECDQILLIYWS